MSQLMKYKIGQQIRPYKKGGAVCCKAEGGMAHGDEKEDRAMVKKMVKPAALTGKKCGGKVKK